MKNKFDFKGGSFSINSVVAWRILDEVDIKFIEIHLNRGESITFLIQDDAGISRIRSFLSIMKATKEQFDYLDEIERSLNVVETQEWTLTKRLR